MIEAWHLSWILPVTAISFFCLGALLTGGDAPEAKEEKTERDECMCVHCPYKPECKNGEII